MAKQIINIGTTANDGTGDPLRTAFNKVNLNFTELYDDISSGIISNSSNVRIITATSSSPKQWRFNANGHIVFPDGTTQTTAFSLADDLIPTQDSQYDLGSPSNQWRSLYVSSNTIFIGGSEIGVSQNGDISVQGIDTSSINYSDNNNSIDFDYNNTNVFRISSENSYDVEIHTDSSNNDYTWTFGANGTLVVSGDLLPEITDNSNFGSSTKVWSTVYVKDLNVTSNSVSIGMSSGETSQQDKAIAIGFDAGKTSQEYDSVAIGHGAGEITQSFDAVAIGTSAGNDDQGVGAVAVGYFAGRDTQGSYAVAVGPGAGDTTQHERAIAIGLQAGYISQDEAAIAIGAGSGEINQGESAVSIGRDAGGTDQGQYAVAVGHWAGETSQGIYATSVGYYAGSDEQGNYSVAVGFESGEIQQGVESVAVGSEAGNDSQGIYAVAIGSEAGKTSQGNYAVAIGSYAGQTSQANNTIIINASGSALNSSSSPGLFVKPIRSLNQSNNLLQYNSSTGEVTYSPNQIFNANNIVESLIPSEDSEYDLGSPTNRWRSLYVSANTIFIGGVPISVENGSFIIEGAIADRNNGNFINLDGDLNDNMRIATATPKRIEIHTDYFDTNYTWTFGSDGGLTVAANVYGRLNNRLWLGGDDSENTSHISIPSSSVSNTTPIEITNPLGGGVDIVANGSTWNFQSSGVLTFPDTTVQTTAFTGNAATIDILNTNGIDTNYSITFVETRDTTQILRADVDLTFNSWSNTLTAGNVTTGVLKIDDGVHEKFQTKQDATGVVTHDCSLGHIFYHTSPDANWTANFTNVSLESNYATTFTLVIAQGGTGYYPNTVQIGGVSQTINWQSNTLPTPSTNRTDVVTFSILNNAGSYIVLGQLTGF